jgi:Cell wall-active antibiotics response LiaF, C-terminal
MTDQPQGVPQRYQGPSQTWKPVLIFGAVVLVLAVVFSEPTSLAQDERIQNGDDSFDDLAIMGGVKRTNVSRDFRGGGATAVMGGVEIDLRDAVMDRKEAVLDVSSVMGGVKIRVPDSWTVVSRVSSVMGGFKDSTRHPANDDHRLILKGTVLMGGLHVSN